MANTETAATTVGKEALAYCTSCKMDLNHMIMALKGDKIAKVQCKTCKKDHAYKPPKGVTTPGEKPAKKTRATKKEKEAEAQTTSIQAEWEKLMITHKAAPSKTYAPKGHFILGDKIKHSTFGEGIVARLIYPNKLEILFEHDLKILIYGGQQAQK